jgi:hypothetical protein
MEAFGVCCPPDATSRTLMKEVVMLKAAAGADR